MTEWRGNRAGESYTYKRVRWEPGMPDHLGEFETYGNITGGRVELSAFTDLKASCTFDFEGGTQPDTTDLVRIYYSFTDDHGDSASVPLGTFFVTVGDVVYYRDGDALIERGSVTGSSTLSVLLDKKLGAPYTVAANTNCVDAANALVKSFDLKTNEPTSNGTVTKSAHTFEPDDSYITVVNWLLSTANYQACYPDPYGNVMIVPYVAPESRPVTQTFADDEHSIMLPEVGLANDWYETPNVFKVYHENDDECLWASASMDYGSRASLASRGGREVTMVESVDELDGASQAARIANLKAIAEQRLIDNASEIEKVTFTHAYIVMQPNDAVQIDYSGTTWKGNVTDMTIDLSPSTQCETHLRRFVPNTLTITTDGGAAW